MPKLEKTNSNMFTKVITEADYNRPLGILRDTLVIVSAAQASSRIIPINFRYIMGVHELEVYLNGIYMRRNELIDGIVYGDYIEYSNFSIMFNDVPAITDILIEGAQVRFRITSANYKVATISGAFGIDPDLISQLRVDVNALNAGQTSQNNITAQIAHDAFGQAYSLTGTSVGSTRTIGTIGVGNTAPDLANYRVWKTANVSSTSITGFNTAGSNRCDDQRIIIVNDIYTTFVHSTSLYLSERSNILAIPGDILQFVFDGTNWTQFGSASSAKFPIATATGTAQAITATYTQNIVLANKQLLAFVASAANTATAPTFSPNGLTAKSIVKKGGVALEAGDIPAINAVCMLEYNLAFNRWELLNPASPSITGTLNKIMKYTAPNTLVSSTITDDGAMVSVSIPLTATKVYNAVWNDIADFIELDEETIIEYGRAYVRSNNIIRKSNEYAELGVLGIASDTYGYGLGIRNKPGYELPLAIAGFVLAYVDKEYPCGTPLTCTVDGILTKAKATTKSYLIIATYYKNENKQTYGDEETSIIVDNRHWVKVR